MDGVSDVYFQGEKNHMQFIPTARVTRVCWAATLHKFIGPRFNMVYVFQLSWLHSRDSLYIQKFNSPSPSDTYMRQ